MRPSSFPEGVQPSNLTTINPTLSWHKNWTCPEGTVPVKRSRHNYNSKPIRPLKKKQEIANQTESYERAVIHCSGDDYRGAQADLNVWNPQTEAEEISASQIWIRSTDGLEVIQAGWRVDPSMYGDNEPRLFVAWTADDYQSTGCYDIQCIGFVQISSENSLGDLLYPVSAFKGRQYHATFSIFQDQSTGNWWLQVLGVEVGYWPSFLFKQLSTKAATVDFGGVVISKTSNQGRHTTTDMGSGHLPSEGNFGVSSYFRQIKVIDGNHIATDPRACNIEVTNPNYYGLNVDLQYHDIFGFSFYFGGPGFSYNCQ